MPPPGENGSPPPTNIPMPPPPFKRPARTAQPPARISEAAPTQPRPKRRRPDENVDGEKRGQMNFGVGMVKGREEEFGGEGEIVTKIDFNKLPVETLYKYLEVHDLLPRWDVSPWSEEPCTPPNAMYSLPPAQSPIPFNPSPNPKPPSLPGSSPSIPEQSGLVQPDPNPIDRSATNGNGDMINTNGHTATNPSTTEQPNQPLEIYGSNRVDQPENFGQSTRPNPNEPFQPPFNPVNSQPLVTPSQSQSRPQSQSPPPPTPTPPTTRSRTLPTRCPPSPSPQLDTAAAAEESKRGVITLSDVLASRQVLAEKANAHWIKGLGGGQNKEGETIVNFLYKMKVGPGRLLRVYNPVPPPLP